MTKALTLLEAVPHQPEADSFDFHKSWSRLRHACIAHRLLILWTVLITVGLVVTYIKVWPPVFTAEVTLVGESDKDRSRENFYQDWAVFRSDQLTDEVLLMTMGPVLAEVIHRLDLHDEDVYHSFFGYLGYRWQVSWLGTTYRRIKESILPSARGKYDPSPEDVAFARTLIDFRTGVQFDRLMETNIGTLTVRGPTPRVVEIANTLIDVYFAQRRKRQIGEAQAAYNVLEGELKKAQAEVSAVEDRMRRYYAQNDLLLIFEKDKIEIGQLQTLKSQVLDLQTAIAGNEQTLKQIDIELGRETKDVVASRVFAANPVRDGLKDRLNALQISRKQTLINYRPDSPEVRDLDKQIGIITQQLGQQPDSDVRQTTTVLSSRYEDLRGRAASLRAELAGQRATLAMKSQAADQMEAALRTIPDKMQAVHDFDREHQALEKKVAALQEKMMIASVSLATAPTAYSTIRVAEQAAAPSEPVWPKTKLLLLAAVALGLLAGVLLALLMDLFFGRVHRFRLASAGRELPIYAIVRRDSLYARDLFALTGPDDSAGTGDMWQRG